MKIEEPVDIGRAVLPALHSFPKQRSDLAPYGIIWYAINIPIGWMVGNEAWLYWGTTALWNTLITISTFFYSPLWFQVLFGIVSMFNVIKAPWNASICWLCLLGFINPVLLAIPILAKFPIGNKQALWGQTRQALTWQKNPYYYGTLVVLWLAILWLVLPHKIV